MGWNSKGATAGLGPATSKVSLKVMSLRAKLLNIQSLRAPPAYVNPCAWTFCKKTTYHSHGTTTTLCWVISKELCVVTAPCSPSFNGSELPGLPPVATPSGRYPSWHGALEVSKNLHNQARTWVTFVPVK